MIDDDDDNNSDAHHHATHIIITPGDDDDDDDANSDGENYPALTGGWSGFPDGQLGFLGNPAAV
eukprot:1290026-Pyramimonas_sp.AAC.2